MKLYSEEELKAYLTEHLKYERHMLGFAYKKLFDSKEETWCAMFECFGIHARILHDFLRNEGKSNTIKAVHYVNNYKCLIIQKLTEK